MGISISTMSPADHTSAALADAAENRVAKRNAFVYAICQAFNGAAAPVNIALGGLAGSYLLAADKSLATAPVTGFSVGMALGTVPAAMLTRYIGRKFGFIGGLVINNNWAKPGGRFGGVDLLKAQLAGEEGLVVASTHRVAFRQAGNGSPQAVRGQHHVVTVH